MIATEWAMQFDGHSLDGRFRRGSELPTSLRCRSSMISSYDPSFLPQEYEGFHGVSHFPHGHMLRSLQSVADRIGREELARILHLLLNSLHRSYSDTPVPSGNTRCTHTHPSLWSFLRLSGCRSAYEGCGESSRPEWPF